MQQIPNSSGVIANLTSGQTSAVMHATRTGTYYVWVRGSLSTATVTLEVSPTGESDDFETLGVDLDGSGTAVDQIWDDADGKPKIRAFKFSDIFFRVTVEAAGAPSVDVRVAGEGLREVRPLR